MSSKPNTFNIVIDARLYGTKHTGIGRYTKNLLLALTKLPNFRNYKFTLIVYKNLLPEIQKDLGSNFDYYPINIPHYSLSEQLFLPLILLSLRPTLVHFTHFNKPLFYFGTAVVTIHDLIKHFYKDPQATTRNVFIYNLKHFFYKIVVFLAIKTSSHLIVPSNFWRNYIIKNYNISPSKITTTYEAPDPTFSPSHSGLSKIHPSHYILYTGNLYPHKNIKVIFKALKSFPNLKLKIICARNIFSNRALKLAQRLNVENQIEFLGFIPDSKFSKLYQNALCLVHPSFMEGFSLTGLEAMALNCPVISSNFSCLPEIYGDSVLYFDPNNSDDLVSKIKTLQSSPSLRQKLISLGHQQIKKYSWTRTAKQTMKIYTKML